MASFNTVKPLGITIQKKIDLQQTIPKSIKPSSLSRTNIANTQSEILGPFSLNDSSSLTITSIVVNETNPDFRLGAVPYNIVFFQTSLGTANIIGYGVTGDYVINNISMPVFTPFATDEEIGGSDGNNLVFVTELINNSGMTQTIYAITGTRVFVPTGGQAQ